MNFIDVIAPLIQEIGPKYGIMVNSPVIAQAILESASGTSELAVNCNNFFGLKYRDNRCPTADKDPYVKKGTEQNPDGSYVTAPMLWFKFPDIKSGVTGYYDFINVSNYANLKGVTDPETYLTNIKADGYATSINYVKNLMAVIDKYDLTKYDNKEGEIKMADSSLVTYERWTQKFSPSSTKKSKITIHHMAGVMTAKQCIDYHISCNKACSANYYVGNDGSIGQSVHEKDRAWTSSSSWNDSQAITIEVSNSMNKEPWAISDAAYKALIALCVDICKRQSRIKCVNYDGTKNAVLTEHRMFAATACPGTTIHNELVSQKIVQDINNGISGSTPTPDPSTGYVYNGLDYSPVFNPTYYSSKYSDLGAAGLKTETQLFQHFLMFGMNEARQAHPDFDPIKYKAVEKDVAEYIGDDWVGYYKHYLIMGRQEIAEGKRAPFM